MKWFKWEMSGKEARTASGYNWKLYERKRKA
jgi:hypothetical protein